MLGLNILLHSVKLVFLNWKTALRISSPLIIVMLAFGIAFQGGGLSVDLANVPAEFPWGLFALGFLAYGIAALWVAVAWHRYVLLEEDSGSILPIFQFKPIGAYLLQGIQLFVIMFIAGLILGFVIGFIASAIGGIVGFLLTGIVVTGAILWLFYRYSPTLPAAALGTPMSIGDAWDETKPYSSAILALVVAMSVASVLLGAVIEPIFAVSPLLHTVLNVVYTWASVMVGISVLTTIYGVAVENREL